MVTDLAVSAVVNGEGMTPSAIHTSMRSYGMSAAGSKLRGMRRHTRSLVSCTATDLPWAKFSYISHGAQVVKEQCRNLELNLLRVRFQLSEVPERAIEGGQVSLPGIKLSPRR